MVVDAEIEETISGWQWNIIKARAVLELFGRYVAEV